MSNYTDELQREIERVTLKGNADKDTLRRIASIIFRMDMRLQELEREIVVDDKPAVAPEPPAEVEEEETTQAVKKVGRTQAKKASS